MRLLNFPAKHPEPGSLKTGRLVLRRPRSSDFEAWARLRRMSAGFLRPFEPEWTADELTKASFRARLRHQEADINAGRGLPWFLFDRDNPETLLGGLSVSNIRRGIADTGTLGYWMGEPHAGKGYMKEAVLAVCDHLFTTFALHRIEAATIVENVRSQRLLASCGFQREGQARSYLRINGEWRDHILFARLEGDCARTPIIQELV